MDNANLKGYTLCGYISQVNSAAEEAQLVYNQNAGTRKAYPDIYAGEGQNLNTAVLVVKFPPQTPGLILVRNKCHLLPLMVVASGYNPSSYAAQRLGFPYHDSNSLFADGASGLDFLGCVNNPVNQDNPDILVIMPQGPFAAALAMCIPDLFGATYPEVAVYAPDTMPMLPAKMADWGPYSAPWVKGPSDVYAHPYFAEKPFDQTVNAREGAMAALESMKAEGDSILWAVIANSSDNPKKATSVPAPAAMASRRTVTIDDLTSASVVITAPVKAGLYSWPSD